MINKTQKGYEIVPSKMNRDILESYNFATVRDGVGIFGERLLIRLTEFANIEGYIQGVKMKKFNSRDNLPVKIETDRLGYIRFHMPLTAVMGKSWEYSKASQAIESCLHYYITDFDEKGHPIFYPFITYAKIIKGKLLIDIRQELWQCLLDFSKGFRKIELEVAMKLSSKYALKMYKIVSGQSEPLTYSLEDLKTILGAVYYEERRINGKMQTIKIEKYSRPDNFVKKVIEPAKKELDSSSPYTFEFELLRSKKNNKGRSPINAITFYPKYQKKFRGEGFSENNLNNKYWINLYNAVLSKEEIEMLKHKFGLDDRGIANNNKIWKLYKNNNINLLEELDNLAIQVANYRPKDIPRYTIGVLKCILVKKYHIVIPKS